MWFRFLSHRNPVNVQCICTQGTVGVSRPEGKLPGVPFLTLEAPSRILPHNQTWKTKLYKCIQFNTFLLFIIWLILELKLYLLVKNFLNLRIRLVDRFSIPLIKSPWLAHYQTIIYVTSGIFFLIGLEHRSTFTN